MNSKSYTKLLAPELTKSVLMAAAIYLIAYELLKSSIIKEIRKFYFVGAGYENPAMQRHYASEVLSLDKSVFVASCRWLHKVEAITTEDIQTILNLRELRNKIAHQLPEFLVDDNINITVSEIEKMQEILAKIDSWWIREVELPANPDFVHLDYEEVEMLEVYSGPIIVVSHLIELLKLPSYNDLVLISIRQPNADQQILCASPLPTYIIIMEYNYAWLRFYHS